MIRLILFSDPTDPGQRLAADCLTAWSGSEVAITHATSVDDLIDAEADLVVSLDPWRPKLIGIPSYLYLDTITLEQRASRQFITHVLTYDAYLAATPADRQFIEDLCFGARKLDAPVLDWWPTPPAGLTRVSDATDLAASIASTGVAEADEVLALLLAHPWIRCAAGSQAGERIAGACLTPSDTLPILDDHPAMVRVFGDDLPMVSHSSPIEPAGQEYVALARSLAADPDSAARLRQLFHERRLAIAGETQRDRLIEFHETLAPRKGYRGTAHKAKLAYIVRCGRSGAFLARALDSLAAQGLAGLSVVLVMWREIPDLAALLPATTLDIEIVRDIGGSRGHTLWVGLNHIAAAGRFDYVGILDDDDELLPNHVDRCLSTLDYWRSLALPSKPRGVWSGAVDLHDTQFEHEMSTGVFSTAYSSRIRLLSFSFNSTGRAVLPEAVIPSNSYLFSTELLDREILLDPRIATVGEDTYLLRLLCERTVFSFTAEVTARVCHHGTEQSRFWESEADPDQGGRVALRLFSRAYPVQAFFEAPVAPIPSAWAPLGVPLPSITAGKSAPLAVRHLAGSEIGRDFDGSATRFTTAPLPLGGGRHDIVWRLAGLDLGPTLEGLPISCAVVDGNGLAAFPPEITLTPHLLTLRNTIAMPPGADSTPCRLQLRIDGLCPAATASLSITHAERGLPIQWDEIPADGPVWIYGASTGGRRTLALLSGPARQAVQGFIDTYQSGQMDGLAIRKIDEFVPDEMLDATIMLASIYWPEMLQPTLRLRPRHLCVAYPFLPGGLRYLF
jgi:hypothetical protein